VSEFTQEREVMENWIILTLIFLGLPLCAVVAGLLYHLIAWFHGYGFWWHF